MSTRCGPCHAIAPAFEALAKQYPNVVKCDVDAAKDVASTYRVSAMGVVPFPIVSMFPRSDLWLVGGSQADIRFLTGFQTDPHDRGADKT